MFSFKWLDNSRICVAPLFNRPRFHEVPDFDWHYDNVQKASAVSQLMMMSGTIAFALHHNMSCLIFDAFMSCDLTGQIMPVSELFDLETMENNIVKTFDSNLLLYDRAYLSTMSWRVVSAQYGITNQKTVDVSSAVTYWASRDRLHLSSGHEFNSLFRSDPCPNKVKTLTIELEVYDETAGAGSKNQCKVLGKMQLQVSEQWEKAEGAASVVYLQDAIQMCFNKPLQNIMDAILNPNEKNKEESKTTFNEKMSMALDCITFSHSVDQIADSLIELIDVYLNGRLLAGVVALFCAADAKLLQRIEHMEQKEDGKTLLYWDWTENDHLITPQTFGRMTLDILPSDHVEALQTFLPDVHPGMPIQGLIEMAMVRKMVTCIVSNKSEAKTRHSYYIVDKLMFGRHITVTDNGENLDTYTDYV